MVQQHSAGVSAMTAVTVRRVTDPAELKPVADLVLLRFYPEFAHHFPRPDVEKTLTVLADTIRHGVVLVAERAGAFVGLVVARPTESWFSRELHLHEHVFYVVPEARASRAAVQLVRALRAIAAAAGLPLHMHVGSGANVDRMDRFFERLGFQRVGGNYIGA